jgi:hypothetical protein
MRRVAFYFACSLLMFARPVWAQTSQAALLPSEQEARRHGLVRHWFAVVPVDGVREQVQTVTVAGDQLHFQTNMSRIHVLGSETGQWQWTAQIGPPLPNHFGSAFNSTSVFAVSGVRLYRLNRQDGTLIWVVRLPDVPNAAPSADEEIVTLGTLGGTLYVYDAETRQQLWYFQTDRPISIRSLLLDYKVVCGSEDGLLYVFPVANEPRQTIFRFRTRAPISAPMSYWGRKIIVASHDAMVYAVDVRSGRVHWIHSAGNPVEQPVAVIDKRVYVTPRNGGLHVLDVDTGEVLWKYPRAKRFVAASAKRVYLSDKLGQLIMLERQTGRLLDVWDTHRFDFLAYNDQTDRVYLVSRRGLVVCVREAAHEKPLVHERLTPQAEGPQAPEQVPAKSGE